MEVHKPKKKEFMAKFERHEPLIIDHSAIIQAKQCKRKYFYRIVLGFVEKKTPQFFGFGSCYHRFRETLEKVYMAAPPSERDMPDSQLAMFGMAINSARDLWKFKKISDPPAGDKWDFLTQARLVESCAVAFKHWQKEKQLKRIEVIAVEQNFIVTMPNGTRTAGKADQIVRWNGKPWGRDFKTSSKEQNAWFTATLEPNDQFMRYTYAESELCGEPVQGQLVEILYNAKSTKKGQKGPSIHPYITSRSQTQVDQWVKEQMFYDKILTLMREEDVYPMEEKSCAFCEYRSVCAKPGERAQMAKLEAEFRVEPWDCVSRGGQDE